MNQRLQDLDKRVTEVLQKRLQAAQSAVLRFDEAPCKTCRSVGFVGDREILGGCTPGDLGLRVEGDCAYCPSCNRCLMDES